jgi:hypothetical protein
MDFTFYKVTFGQVDTCVIVSVLLSVQCIFLSV